MVEPVLSGSLVDSLGFVRKYLNHVKVRNDPEVVSNDELIGFESAKKKYTLVREQLNNK